MVNCGCWTAWMLQRRVTPHRVCSHPLSYKPLFYLSNWKFSCPWWKKMRFLGNRPRGSLFLSLSECTASSLLSICFLINKSSLDSLTKEWQSIRNISASFLKISYSSMPECMPSVVFLYHPLSPVFSTLGGWHPLLLYSQRNTLTDVRPQSSHSAEATSWSQTAFKQGICHHWTIFDWLIIGEP